MTGESKMTEENKSVAQRVQELDNLYDKLRIEFMRLHEDATKVNNIIHGNYPKSKKYFEAGMFLQKLLDKGASFQEEFPWKFDELLPFSVKELERSTPRTVAEIRAHACKLSMEHDVSEDSEKSQYDKGYVQACFDIAAFIGKTQREQEAEEE